MSFVVLNGPARWHPAPDPPPGPSDTGALSQRAPPAGPKRSPSLQLEAPPLAGSSANQPCPASSRPRAP
eukprot:8039371-Alexandrium_andersonii.AAC.1